MCRYNERTSKAYGVSLNRCQDEDFRPPVRIYNLDVVNTFKTYEAHLGDDMKDGHLFLSPIQPHPIHSHIWYKKTNVGEAQLARMLKCIAEDAVSCRESLP